MFARLLISLAFLTSLFVSAPLLAGEQIKGVRSWSAPERTRLTRGVVAATRAAGSASALQLETCPS